MQTEVNIMRIKLLFILYKVYIFIFIELFILIFIKI